MPGSGAATADPRPAVRRSFAGPWHYWDDDTPRPGALNMAVDRTLLERAATRGERWLRLYRWAPHCLSFGRHERALRRYDRGAIERRGIDVVRRPTGGRAVWHARELTYAVALPAHGAPGLRAVYLEIHGMVLQALHSLGIPAELAPGVSTPGLEAGACFGRAVGGEIVVSGRKVVGSAQLREAGALLQHGSILLQDDQAMVGSVTLGEMSPDGSAPLERLTGAPIPPARLAEVIAESAEERWRTRWTLRGAGPAVLREADRHRALFSTEAWTWRA